MQYKYITDTARVQVMGSKQSLEKPPAKNKQEMSIIDDFAILPR